jgi:hypothetical protein
MRGIEANQLMEDKMSWRRILTPFGAMSFGSAVLMATVITLSPLAQFLDDPRVFELDADAVTNLGQGGDDWANSAGTASGLTRAIATSAPEAGQCSVSGWPFVICDPPGTTIFTTGGSKDTNDVSQWKNTGGSVPDKDDITNAYAAAYNVTTGNSGAQPHTWIYFGADRSANNGDSNIGFWFFQNSIGPGSGNSSSGTPFTGVPCPSGETDCSPGDLHRDGDVFIVSAFTQGGAIGTIQLYHWDHTAGGLVLDDNNNAAQCNPSGPSQNIVCAIINTGAITAPWPYTPKFGTPQTFPQGSFFEGGFDLTGLFQALGKPQPCFSSFLAETRSSQSTTAQLKDFVLGNFQLCSVSVTKTCAGTPTIVPNGDGTARIHYTFSGNVINDGAGNLFSLTVIDTFPAGALNTSLTQPATPSGGLASGASATYGGSFDFPSEGAIFNTVAAKAAAFLNGPLTVVNDKNGSPATASASFGDPATTCHVETHPAMTLTKSCVVNLAPGGGGLLLQLADTITVCNTSTDTTTSISNINITNSVSNGPSADSIASGLTLLPGQCKTYTPTYIPTGCVNSVLNGANPDPGRCLFTDTARISSIPKDEFGNSLPLNLIPGAQTASCHVCPFGVCTTQGVP